MQAGSFSRFVFAVSLAAAALMTNKAEFIMVAILFASSAMIVWTGDFKSVVEPARPAALFFAFIFVLHLFSHRGQALFTIFGLEATLEGARTGLFYGEKLIVFFYSAYLILKTVKPFELTLPVERLSRIFGRRGRRLSFLALSFSLALRFLPDLVRQGRITMLALKTRGVSFDGSLIGKLRSAPQLLAAVFVNAFKSAESASMALAVKGYSTRHERAVFPAIRILPGSIATLALSAVILVFGLRS